MITPGADLQVYIATRPVDFRKGHDGLAALVQPMFGLDRKRFANPLGNRA
jgi:transposase